MIRSESEYREALRRRDTDSDVAQAQRKALEETDLTPEQIDRAMQPIRSFHAQLEEEIKWYERVSQGDIPTVQSLTQIGPTLIALRIACRVSQKQLAEKLGVAESVVSRDERNEYRGITIERAQRIMDVLEASIIATIQPPHRRRERELVGAY